MLSKFNPFVLALIALNIGAGIWDAVKGQMWGSAYYIFAAALNVAVTLK